MKENNNINTNTKNSKSLLIIIAILLLIILGLLGFIAWNYISNNQNNQSVEEKKQTEKLNVSTTEKTNIENKVYFLLTEDDRLTDQNTMYKENFITGTIRLNNTLLETNKLSEEGKLYYALIDTTRETVNIRDLEERIWQISKKDVDLKMKELFGEGIKKIPEVGVGKCPGFVYDSQSQVFIGNGNCGGVVLGNVYIYNSDYQKIDKNTITVNVTLAYGQITEDLEMLNIYKTYTEYKQVSNYAPYKTEPYYLHQTGGFQEGQFVISENNKKEFDNYKWTFKKDESGNYYFSSMTRT